MTERYTTVTELSEYVNVTSDTVNGWLGSDALSRDKLF